jgi:hypothetical protein
MIVTMMAPMVVGMIATVQGICGDHAAAISGESDTFWLQAMLDKHDFGTFLM